MPEVKAEVAILKKGSYAENGPIRVTVNAAELKVSMDLSDFLDVVVAALGSPALLFTQAALRERIQAAAAKVLVDMKAETAKL